MELDHVFICCAEGAPEADALVEAGLTEGSGNLHPGQGTANRRFFFRNLYLELLWVEDEDEARSPRTEATRLWQRWSGRDRGACPFGLVFRPGTDDAGPPFETRSYQPTYLPPGLSMWFAEGTPLSEPELVHLPFVSRDSSPFAEPTEHRLGAREIVRVCLTLPGEGPPSAPCRAVEALGKVRFERGEFFRVELEYRTNRPRVLDLRPGLPLVFRGR